MSRFSLNQATIKRAPLEVALRVAAEAGIESIGLWREPVQEVGLAAAADAVRASGLRVSSLCRAGFFTMPEGPDRRAALDDDRRAIEEAAAVGAPVLVLVAGGLPAGSRDLVGARSAAADAVAELVPDAAGAGVRLAIEPMHPVFTADRGVVSTLAQALDLAAPFDAGVVGAVVDTYHVWWDPQVAASIARAGREGRIASYQVSDWVVPLEPDTLLSRGLPGDGSIDFRALTALVRDAGYGGDVECEVFRESVWAEEPGQVARRARDAYERLVEPFLS